MNLIIVDEVYEDLRAARDWYSGRHAGLGEEFVDLFFRTARDLPGALVHSAVDETGYHPKRMPRFTAVIYYDLTKTGLIIVGLLVNGRSTSNLLDRG